MTPVPLSDSLSGWRRERKARKLARLLVALDDAAGERRVLLRRSRVSLGSAR